MHLSDEALSGLGTTFQFLRFFLFGAITQIYDPQSIRAPRKSHPTHVTRPPEQDTDIDLDMQYTDHSAQSTFDNEDPHIPTKPARRKAALATQTQYQATQDTSLQDSSHHPEQARLTDYVPNLGYFVAGGLSGITSRTATAPLDRLKVYLIAQTGTATEAVQAAKRGAALQATKHGMSTMWNACKELWAAGGLRSLFAGM